MTSFFSSPETFAGRLLNQRYRLEHPLGQGGMGTVFKAFDTLLDRPVAVKLLTPGKLGTAGRSRLLREARAVARLNHPNIVAVYDAGEDEGAPFVVMELLEGDSLHETPPANLPALVEIAKQVCRALAEAHVHGIIHRDLKPENIILTPAGAAKLTDFGLALSPQPDSAENGAFIGTAFYVSPEQALGRELDGRADLYSLGVLLYEFSSGQLPFSGEDPVEIISRHISEQPTPPSRFNPKVPPGLDALILRLLEKEPEKRFADANQVLNALHTALGEPPSSADAPRHNLPLELTSFIGRQRELKEVRALLDEHRLVTLTGVGGTGKTRLALQTARALLDAFPQGVWAVELSSLADPTQATRALASALGVREESNTPLSQTLVEFLKNRQALLLLDNCEHLISYCATTAEAILSACPHIKILATSREALGVPGERAYHVRSLALPDLDAVNTAEDLWRAEALQLFHARALAANPDFSADWETGLAVARICERLDGIPLAIELAAARVRSLPVEEIAARLNDRFKLLTGGSRSAMPRQQTLQALIDWSYELLTEPECLLLRCLAVFAGGWSIAAAEQVCAAENLPADAVLEPLTRLVDKSLVNLESGSGEARYSMLETIRQYAREKSTAAELQALRDRHLAYFAAFASQLEPALWRREQKQWLARASQEHDNLRLALEWALSDPTNHERFSTGARLAADLGMFWNIRGFWREGADWYARFILAADSAALALPPMLLTWNAHLNIQLGQLNFGRDLFERAYSEAEQQGDELARAFALFGRANVRQVDCANSGNEDLSKALLIFRALNHQPGAALVLSSQGNVASENQDWSAARAFYMENMDICRALGHRLGLAGTYMALANIEVQNRQLEQARIYLEESASIYRDYGDIPGIGSTLRLMGYIELVAENLEKARAFYEDSLRLSRETFSRPGIGMALTALGEIARGQGDYAAARAYYEESAQANEEFPTTVAISLHNLGYVALHQNDLPAALDFFRRSLEIARSHNYERVIYFCLAGIACVYVEMDTCQPAARLLSAAQRGMDSSGAKLDPVDQREVDTALSKLRELCAEGGFEREWQAGQKAPLEELLSMARSVETAEIERPAG